MDACGLPAGCRFCSIRAFRAPVARHAIAPLGAGRRIADMSKFFRTNRLGLNIVGYLAQDGTGKIHLIGVIALAYAKYGRELLGRGVGLAPRPSDKLTQVCRNPLTYSLPTMFTFLKRPGMPPHNNHTEQEIHAGPAKKRVRLRPACILGRPVRADCCTRIARLPDSVDPPFGRNVVHTGGSRCLCTRAAGSGSFPPRDIFNSCMLI